MLVEVQRLGLAVYMKNHGCKLVRVGDRRAFMESDKAVDDWEIEYLNSVEYKHDVDVINIKKSWHRKLDG